MGRLKFMGSKLPLKNIIFTDLPILKWQYNKVHIFRKSPKSLMFFSENMLKWSEVAQSCPTLCYSMDCSPPGSSVHGIARILKCVAIAFSRRCSTARDCTWVSRTVDRHCLSHQESQEHVKYWHTYNVIATPLPTKYYNERNRWNLNYAYIQILS